MARMEELEFWAHKPGAFKAFMDFCGTIWGEGLIEYRLREIVRYRAGTLVKCEHCTNMRIAEAREEGLTEELLQKAMRYEWGELSEREKTALMYAELLITTPGDITDSLYAEVKRLFSDAEIAELTLWILSTNFHQRLLAALQVRAPAAVKEDEVYLMRFKRFGQVSPEHASTTSGRFKIETLKRAEL